MLSYINRFRFPFPAFDGYDAEQQRIYPFCAVIKLLIALYETGREAKLSIEDIFHYIIANHCSGYEDIDFYKRLVPEDLNITDTEKRQVREMAIFISQLSLLKVYNGSLWLDVTNEAAIAELVEKFLTPKEWMPSGSRLDEFMTMTRLNDNIVLPTIEIFAANASDMEFIEGRRRRVEHFRVDRSPLLRRYYREQHQHPVCDMCHMDVTVKYPWTDYLLDIHHLLPLSSGVAITTRGTSLDDIVGLCPTCHRSIHIYYTKL
jgi:hypothetical protein